MLDPATRAHACAHTSNTVWKDAEHGIAQVLENLKKKQHKLSRLGARIGGDDPIVLFQEVSIHTVVLAERWNQLVETIREHIRLMGSRRAALQRRREVLERPGMAPVG